MSEWITARVASMRYGTQSNWVSQLYRQGHIRRRETISNGRRAYEYSLADLEAWDEYRQNRRGARISKDERAKIVEMLRSGVSQKEVARRVNRNPLSIWRIAADEGLSKQLRPRPTKRHQVPEHLRPMLHAYIAMVQEDVAQRRRLATIRSKEAKRRAG